MSAPGAGTLGVSAVLRLADLAAHPRNPRTALGDLAEITASIAAHGVFEPLVVLTRAAYETERSRRHLIAARRAIAAWARLFDPSSAELRQAFAEVSEGIRQATALAAKARPRQNQSRRKPRGPTTSAAGSGPSCAS